MAEVEVQQVQQPEGIRKEDERTAAAETAQIAAEYGEVATRAVKEILAEASAPGQDNIDRHNAA